jgi:hypothetical protein
LLPFDDTLGELGLNFRMPNRRKYKADAGICPANLSAGIDAPIAHRRGLSYLCCLPLFPSAVPSTTTTHAIAQSSHHFGHESLQGLRLGLQGTERHQP